MSPAEFQKLLDELAKLLREQGIEPSELARALLEQDTGRLEKMLRDAAGRAGIERMERSFQEGQFAQGMQQALGIGDLARELENCASSSGSRDVGAEIRNASRWGASSTGACRSCRT